MKRGLVFLLVFFILIGSISFVSSFSSENIGNLSHLITTQYGPSDYIKGWINISLEDEPTKSVFEDDEGNSINLIDLLNINKDLGYDGFDDFSCTPRNCETDYSATNPQTEKTFSLDKGNFTIFGFEFTGKLTAVNSINFTLESDSPPSCDNQLKIDFFNDKTIVVGNDKTFDEQICEGSWNPYGCFNKSKNTEEYTIRVTPHCQKIRLTESPGFKIGAWVKKETAGTKKLTMELRNYDKSCKLTMGDISDEGGEISCNIDYLITKPEDYYVCIYSDDGTGEYRIRGNENPSMGCGFHGISIPSETPGAYQIFAKGKMFEALRGYPLEISGDTLAEEAHEYITKTYGGGAYVDCSSGCVVPIKFISGMNQNITIKNLTIKYEKEGVGEVTKKDFYDLNTTTAIVNADFQKLYLDGANFSVPSEIDNHTFELTLNDIEIFSEEISVEKVPEIKSLKPTTTASAYPTEFEVTIEPDGNITEYVWDFENNNDTETTAVNKVTYTYDSTGTYKLEITVTDSNQRSSSRIFIITVGTPEEEINRKLTKMRTDLENVKAQINAFNSFLQDSLESILDINELDEKLTAIYTANASAVNESDYNQIMTDLLKLEGELPESITESASADSISFYPEESDIDLDILKAIGGGDYDTSNESKYIDAVLAWNQENVETKITFKELSAKYKYSEGAILRTFELDINKKNEEYNPYLILRKLDNLEFKEDYSEKNESGYVYIDLTDSQTTIIFSTTEDVDFADLPAFISPRISELSILDGDEEENETLLKLAIFILIIFLLVIIGFVSYIVLQTWYKKKYESHLFKNRNDLYNLVSYIQSSKKRGLENKDIISKLKKSGWKSEQITYIMRKYVGKRTGMFEIPVGKILSGFKKKEVKNLPPGRPMRNFSRPKTFNSRGTRKRFS